MTTDPLADALAELRRQTDADDPWNADDFEESHPALGDELPIILNAVLSGDLMPRSGHLALMAAGNEAAASAFMDAVWDALKADANDLRKQQRILEAYRALTTADQQAALDRVIRAAVAAERERCAGLADAQERQAKKRSDEADDETQTDFAAGVLFGTEIGARVIAAAIRTPDAPASADAGRAE